MSSAYRRHPASRYSSPAKLRHKLGLALAFIAFGSIAGASGIVLHLAGAEPDGNDGAVIAAAPRHPGAAPAASPAAPPPPAVSAPKALPSDPVQTAPAAVMIAAAPEPAPLAAPAPELPAAITSADAEAAATESHPPPPAAAAKKAKKKAARSQGRRDRGWYNAYAWSPRADYGRGRSDYGRPIW